MIRPVPETPPFPTKEDWAYILMALGTLHNMQPYYRVEAHVATLAAAQGTARQLEEAQNARAEDQHLLFLLEGKLEQAEAAYAALREAAQALVQALDDPRLPRVYGKELAALRAGLQGTGPTP